MRARQECGNAWVLIKDLCYVLNIWIEKLHFKIEVIQRVLDIFSAMCYVPYLFCLLKLILSAKEHF